MKTPINAGILQSDLDVAGFDLINFDGGTGLPSGGTTGQLLQKQSSTDGDADWATVASGGGTGLDENTVTGDDIGLVGDGVTDNTTALQAWLDSVDAAKVNSTLLVPDGVYIFSGALRDTGYRNAQILLPTVALTDSQYSVTIKGYHPICFSPWPGTTAPCPQGPVFRSTLASGSGTQPSFIGGKGPSGGVGPDLDYLCVRFENMIFQTVSNPQISCLNMSHITYLELRGDVLIMAGTGIGETDSVQPTTTTSYGLILPPNDYGVLPQVENVSVFNFYTGVWMGELAHVSNVGCYLCQYALQFGFAHHITLIERLLDWHCKYGVRMTGAHTFQIGQHDIERAPAALWYTRVYDIDDASNQATAEITWWTVTAYIGAEDTYTINGGSNVRAHRAGTIGASTVYVGTDARLVAVSGGAKLEARNTGTGVWVEAARWTNP